MLFRWIAAVTRWGAESRWRLLAIFAVTASFVGLLAGFDARIRPEDAPSVVDLELAFSAASFKHVLLRWGSAGVAAFRESLAADFLFPIAYGLFLAALYVWTATGLGQPIRPAFAYASWVAAGLDWIENALLLWLTWSVGDEKTLAGLSPSPTLVWIMSSAAALKFALLFLSAAGTLLALFASACGRVLVTCRFSLLSVPLGSLPLIVVPQGQDVLRSLVDATTPPLVRFFAIAALLVWSASVWYWARVLLMIELPGVPAPPAVFVTWVPRILGTLTLVLSGFAFFQAASGNTDHRVFLVLFGALCLLLAVIFHQLVKRRRGLLGITASPLQRYVWPRLPWATKAAAATCLGLSTLCLVLFTCRPVGTAQSLGTLTVLLMAAANAVFFGSATVLFARLLRVPLVSVAFAAAVVFSAWNDDHVVRIARESGRPVSLKERPGLVPTFDRWLEERRRPGEEKVPVFLVAAEGGGIRAAFWTATVLARLQDQDPSFARQVFAISSVSGGSLGAATFVSLLADQPPKPCPGKPRAGVDRLQHCAEAALGDNFLAPVLAKMVAPDFLQWFVPVPVRSFDRGWALEDAWAAGYRRATKRDRFSERFQDLWSGGATSLPALFLNGAHVQTGRRLLLSHLSWAPEDIPDSGDLHELLGADLPLKTAVHNSARFAYVSPAGRLVSKDGEHGHVVDGGYFENSGMATLHDIWHALSEKSQHAHDARFVVLYLCNSPSRCWLGDGGQKRDEPLARPQNLAELFSPIRALLGARDARGALALAEIRREGPGPRRPPEHAIEFVEFGVCRDLDETQRRAPLPLGWQLSEGVRRVMTEQLAGRCPGNVESGRRVLELLARGAPHGPP